MFSDSYFYYHLYPEVIVIISSLVYDIYQVSTLTRVHYCIQSNRSLTLIWCSASLSYGKSRNYNLTYYSTFFPTITRLSGISIR